MFQVDIYTTGKLNKLDIEDKTALGAIETIYNYGEDEVIFKFDDDIGFSAWLSGDISDSWFDIINLMKDLESSKNEFSMQFPSQTFWHYWEFKEIDGSKWEIRIYWGHNEKKTFRVQKGIFKKEFNKIIVRIESDLKKQGYKLSDFREYQ